MHSNKVIRDKNGVFKNAYLSDEEKGGSGEFESLSRYNRIVGVLYTECDTLADAIIPDTVTLLYGQDYLMEEVLGLIYESLVRVRDGENIAAVREEAEKSFERQQILGGPEGRRTVRERERIAFLAGMTEYEDGKEAFLQRTAALDERAEAEGPARPADCASSGRRMSVRKTAFCVTNGAFRAEENDQIARITVKNVFERCRLVKN